MQKVTDGFVLNVVVEDMLPRVRISLANGEVIVDTNSVSITGLAKLARVVAVAASTAGSEMRRILQQDFREKPATVRRTH